MPHPLVAYVRKRLDGFLVGMALAVTLAFLAPGPGAEGGALRPEALTRIAVATVFFLHGLTLAPDALRAGARRWPLHVLIQGTTFLFFPLLGLALLTLAGGLVSPDLATGFFFLCAVPSTVASSVALTAAVRGNVAAALFNASASTLLGVLLTPAWMAWWLGATGGMPPVGGVVLDLLRWLVAPFLAGQLVRPWLGALAARHERLLHVVDRGTILLIVYTAFAGSVSRGVWAEHGIGVLATTAIGVVVLLAASVAATWAASRMLGFSAEDRAAAVFCGSQKTLATGVPMARLILGTHPALGIILLPVIVYHPIQLVLGAVLASRWAPPTSSGSRT